MFKMNKIIQLLILLVFPLFSFAQSNFPPCTAYDKNGKDTLRALNSHSNSLYAGIDNLVEVVKTNLNYKKILIKCSNGLVFADNTNTFNIIPSKTGTILLFVYQYDEGDTVLVFTKAMNVLKVPSPYVDIERVKISDIQSIDREFFKKNKRFEVHVSDDFVDDSQWYNIKEFSVGFAKGQFYVSKNCLGSVLSDDAIELISKVIPGKEVSFVFTITGTGDIFMRMPPVKVKIN